MPGMPRSPLARTTIRDALDSALIALGASGVESPRLDAEVLLAAAMGVDRAVVVADPRREIEPDAARRFQEFARRRVQREPVAYILGRKGFRTIELEVDPRVLIPRPETEHLVEAVMDLAGGERFVDVGTGSGAVALALKAERPDFHVTATDTSAAALEVAAANARRLGLDVELVHGDLVEGVPGRIDTVISNPPYVAEPERARLAPEITRYEPAEALFAGPDGLAVIRRLIPAAYRAGAETIALEIGSTQAAETVALMEETGFFGTEVLKDLAGLERVVVGWRT
jgi:release factor glutamine methyltransferase